jgi:hypothetical protein
VNRGVSVCGFSGLIVLRSKCLGLSRYGWGREGLVVVPPVLPMSSSHDQKKLLKNKLWEL